MIDLCQYTGHRVLPKQVMSDKIPDRVPETFLSIRGVVASIDLLELHLTTLKNHGKYNELWKSTAASDDMAFSRNDTLTHGSMAG